MIGVRQSIIVLVVVGANLVLSDGEPNYYDVLGVRRSASKQDIKQRYKQLAREWHPDKNQDDPRANEKFMQINEAYEVLGDDDKRREYDTFGTVHARSGGEPGNAYGAQRFGFPFRFSQGDSPFRFEFGDFSDFFRGFQSPFGNERKEDLVRKYAVTYRTFQLDVIPQSYERPFLIYAYTTMCYACGRTDTVFEQAINELEQVGVAFGSLHIDADRSFAASLRVERGPAMLAVLSGRTYRLGRAGELFSLSDVRSFVRSLFFESSLVVTLSDDRRVDSYLAGAVRENRVRAVLFKRTEVVPLRLVLVAFRFRNFTNLAFYPLTRCSDANNELKAECHAALNSKVKVTEETFVVFDDKGAPQARISDPNRIERTRLDEQLTASRFLMLPRISSASHFDTLCRVEPLFANRELCVILISNTAGLNSATFSGDEPLGAYREFAQRMSRLWPNVKFAYVLADRQVELVRMLASSSKQYDIAAANSAIGHVAVVWRRASDEFSYELSSFSYTAEESFAKADDAVRSFVETVRDDHRRPRNVAIFETSSFVDEHALPLYVRILQRLYEYTRRMYEAVTSVPFDTYMYYFSTVLFCVAIGYMMYFFNKIEEQQIAKDQNARSSQSRRANAASDSQQRRRNDKEKQSDAEDDADDTATDKRAKNSRSSVPVERTAGMRPDGKPVLCELNASTYRELIVRSELGALTVVLLLDDVTKQNLLERFVRHAVSLARVRSVRFAFSDVHKTVNWYRVVLARAVGDATRLARVEAANCIGTVIAVNGYRRWFSIYHVRHPASLRISKRLRSEVCGDSSASSSDLEDLADGDTNGAEVADDDGLRQRKLDVAQMLANQEAQDERARLRTHRARVRAVRSHLGPLSAEEMLFGLDNWLDRLFEGSLERYRINEWPERFEIFDSTGD